MTKTKNNKEEEVKEKKKKDEEEETKKMKQSLQRRRRRKRRRWKKKQFPKDPTNLPAATVERAKLLPSLCQGGERQKCEKQPHAQTRLPSVLRRLESPLHTLLVLTDRTSTCNDHFGDVWRGL